MDYILKRTQRSASIRVSLNQSGEVVVTAPKLVPQFMVDTFVNRNKEWIERQKHKISLRQTANPSLDWDKKIISYLGLLYSIKVVMEADKKVEFVGGACIVRPITGSIDDAKQTLLRYLHVQAEIYIQNRVSYWAEQMQTHFGTVRFGQQLSRWGSCSGDNNLRFNWRLIHFPKAVIDYVVIHELAHTVHHNHSEQFWHLVEQYCSDWKEQRRFLKRQVVIMER